MSVFDWMIPSNQQQIIAFFLSAPTSRPHIDHASRPLFSLFPSSPAPSRLLFSQAHTPVPLRQLGTVLSLSQLKNVLFGLMLNFLKRLRHRLSVKAKIKCQSANL